jgi:RHS repeat-associated protein
LRIDGDRFTEDITHETGWGGATGYYDGRIKTTSFTYNWAGKPADYAVQYTYDDVGQLTSADNNLNNAWDIGIGNTISYDANGNILDLRRGSTTKTYAYYTGTNKVQNTDGAGNDYIYDSNANVTSSSPKSINTIAYDPFTQRPTSVNMSSEASLTLEYGGDTQRVLKNYNNGTSTNSRLYLHGDNDYPLLERNRWTAAPETTATYIYGLSGAFAKRTGSTVLFLLKDHLGSTRVVMDATGLARTYYDYDALGTLIRSGTVNEVKYQFTGQEFDESNLHNYLARLYDSDLGKFYAMDPVGQGWSPFVYAGNNPVVIVDPDGQFAWFVPILIGAGIGAIGGGVYAENHGGEWWQGALAGAVVGGAAGYFAGAALAPAYAGASSPLFAGLTVKGAIAGAGIGTAWGIAQAGSGNTSWDNVWKYGVTGTVAGASIGFGSGMGYFSNSQATTYAQLSGWEKIGASARFWGGLYASLGSLTEVNGSTINYWPALLEGAYAGTLSGIASTSYVQLSNWPFGDKAGRWIRTGLYFAGSINAYSQSGTLEHSMGGFLESFGSFFPKGFELPWNLGRFDELGLPFSRDAGSILFLDDMSQTTPTKILGSGRRGKQTGYGSPINNYFRFYLCKRLGLCDGGRR